jgi:dihydrofolate synthase/folylpolyglutamate synthase
MAYLGDPHRALDVIHIGGTSGKGSNAMMCEAILQAAGQRVGTHTSPYLQTPLEKVRVDGRLIGAQEAIRLSDRIVDAVARLRAEEPGLGEPHYAEAWLGMALCHFADSACRVGVVEVGMGGRYDATNILVPRVAAITTVHYDHTRVLGETLAEIAFHKAGIIKPGVPVVSGNLLPEAMAVIESEAERQGARLIRVGRDVHFEPRGLSEQGGRFHYRGLSLDLDDVEVGLLGEHQIENAATALAALEVYADDHAFSLDESAIRRGLAAVRFAGRIEVVQRQPTVILDGAHNEEKVGALVAALRQIFRYDRLIMVLGMLETKSADPIVHQLASVADVIITTAPQVKGKPAIPANALAVTAQLAGVEHSVADGPPLEALGRALSLAGPNDLVVVTGSLYLLGEVRSHWHGAEDIVAARTTFPNHAAGR